MSHPARAQRPAVVSVGDRDDRPSPRRPPEEPTVWLDFVTGRGVDDGGRTVEPIIGGRRKRPKLVDLLETARHHHARRLMLSGAVPIRPAEWLLPDERTVTRGENLTPDWVDEGHYLDDPPQGRFKHEPTGHRLAVCLVREWFPEPDPDEALSPRQAQFSWNTLTFIVQQAIQRDWPLFRLPGQTILNIWKLRAPDSYGMERLDLDIGQEIQANEPQHRVEHYVAAGRCDCGDCLPLIPDGAIAGFAYGDGRFFFHGAPPKELGAAPAHRMTAQQAEELFTTDQYWPARYQVTFTVPARPTAQADWDTLGLFPVKREHERGWHWPNRPGARHTTWVDASELYLALSSGWRFTIHEGVRFSKVNSLQFLANTNQRMLDLTEQLSFDGQPASPQLKATVASATRQMFRVGIGSFARRPRLTTRFAVHMSDVPAHAVGPADRVNGGFVYRLPTAQTVTDSETWHPEIAARVWATSRVRVLRTPTKKVTRGPLAGDTSYGALAIPPDELIGITGDAIYTTTVQDWMLPEEHGGGDDGRSGRIRMKGWLSGPLPAPPDITTRQRLSKQAEQNGWRDVL